MYYSIVYFDPARERWVYVDVLYEDNLALITHLQIWIVPDSARAELADR